MAVHFGVQAVQSLHHSERGVSRYVGDLADTLEARHRGLLSSLVYDPARRLPGRLDRHFARGLLRPADALRPDEGDIYHLGSGFEHTALDRLWPPAARRAGCALVVTLFDLIPLLHPDRYLDTESERRFYAGRLRLLQIADRVHAISASTAADAVDHLGLRPERVDVVGAGVSPIFVPPPAAGGATPAAAFAATAAASRLVAGLRPGFILCTGGGDWRKNLTFLLVAYSCLPEPLRRDHQLVVVCKLDAVGLARVRREIDWLGLTRDVLLTGLVTDEALVALYQTTDLFVFPSRYEGFGLPLAEALACGAPAICGAVSSLPEILPDPEAHFDPDDPRSIRQAIERALVDPQHLQHLRSNTLAPQHRWDAVADRTAESYQALGARRHHHRPRRRLALVSPLPPTPSGVADYSFRLASALSSLCDVTVLVDDSREVVAPDGVTVALVSEIDKVEAEGGAFDSVLCAIGNQTFHISAIQLLARRRCSALLHDIRLDGLWAWASVHRRDFSPITFHERLQKLYAGRVPSDLGDRGWLERSEAEEWGIWMVGGIVRQADQTFCHSNYAAGAARLDAGVDFAGPVGVLPFGHPAALRRAPADGATPPLVASFGVVTAVKGLDVLLSALFELATDDPELRVALVGNVSDDQREICLARAESAGLAGRLIVTGRLSADAYRQWLQQTTVAVQLRAATGGESSAAVADCLAAGIPTIVTRLGAQADLGSQCVEMVERSIGGSDLAARIRGLLDDPDRRRDLAVAGQAYARDRSFQAVAGEIYRRVVLPEYASVR
jgi:glycosyltransferase involved in cell wall biosynthesis